jgi:metallo-beta-lactamase class B
MCSLPVIKGFFIGLIFFITSGFLQVAAQGLPINPDDNDPQRTEPIEPFRIIDNVYYVGATVHHSAYLFTSPEGHILLDATYERFVLTIIKNVEKLGFNANDIKVILSNHAHPDHVEGLASMREYTGATTVATAPDAEVIVSGGMADFRDREGDPYPWTPATIDRIIEDGEKISVGNTELTAHMTAGHTKGCTTWTIVAEEDGEKYDVVVLCAVRINTSMPLVNHPKYPTMPQDLAYTFARLKILPVDIYLGPHGWIFGLQEKLERMKKGSKVNVFIDRDGFQQYILGREREYLDILKTEIGKIIGD